MANVSQNEVMELEKMLRERERALRTEIRENLLRSEHEHHKDLAGMVSDIGDESVADMLTDIEIAAVGRDVGELREVESALVRVRERTYGVCVDCNEPIGHARLKAQPAAARCLSCQAQQERASGRHTTSL
ncbi:MAG: TraR/DksA family transcriptional regulator [Burkholderiales bacterium]